MPSTPTAPDAEAPAPYGTLPITYAIAGTQKSATTTLSQLLDRHRRICRGPRKELEVFDREDLDWGSITQETLRYPRRSPGQEQLGDATPTYLWWPGALERMHRYNPDMRIIATFRDPLERLFSQWVMVINRWPLNGPDWPTFITRFRPTGLYPAVPDGVSRATLRTSSGVVRGYYGAQVQRAIEVFGREQTYFVEFGDLLTGHRPILEDLTGFLGIHPYRGYPELPHGMRGQTSAYGTAPTPEDIEGLVELYRDDHALFVQLTGLDTSRWPLTRILAGETTPAELAAKFSAKITGPYDARPVDRSLLRKARRAAAASEG